ncbi:hypothetical protein CPC08DRAFT_649859, partial [Agrocybe pediades]
IWDALENKSFMSHVFMILGFADSPGLTYFNRLTGHSGAHGIQYGYHLYCLVLGR